MRLMGRHRRTDAGRRLTREVLSRRFKAAIGAGESVAAVLIPIIVVSVLALAATMGWFSRNVIPDGEYLLFLEYVGSHTKMLLATFLIFVGIFAGMILALIHWGGNALDRSDDSAPGRRVITRINRGVDWVLARWWRLSALLAVAWSPLIVGQFPGTSNADLVMQAREVLGDRGEIDYPPFNVYPIAHYLVPNDEVLLSEHHNALLTLMYGTVLGKSLEHFGSFEVGFIILTMSQLAITLIAFGRASELLSRWVTRPGARSLFLAVLILSGFPTALWAVAIAKNPLFGAAFVWLIALAFDHVRSRESPHWMRALELVLPAVMALNSAKFAQPILAVLLIMVLIAQVSWAKWRVALAGLALPILLTQLVVDIGIAQEKIIPGDPMAGKGLQIQSMALTLKERPGALSPEDERALNEIFDVEMMIEGYQPRTMAPVRGAGFREGAYQWREVTRQEASEFNGIWRRLALAEPDMVVNGALLTSYRFFDPFTPASDNRPSITNDDSIQTLVITDGATLSDDFTNLERRETLHEVANDLSTDEWLLLPTNGVARTVVVILLATAAIILRRPAAWIWALPMALHCGVFLLSPLDSSGRYALGVTYFMPFAILAFASARSVGSAMAGSGPVESDTEAAASTTTLGKEQDKPLKENR